MRWVPLALFTPLAVAFIVLYVRQVRRAWRLPDIELVITVDTSAWAEAMKRAGASVNALAESMKKAGDSFRQFQIQHVVTRSVWRNARTGKPMSADMVCSCGWEYHTNAGPRGVLEARRQADLHEDFS